MSNKQEFQLNGTNKEKAEQLINRMKQGSLSKEILTAILPYEKEFYKSLVEMFRAQLDAESNNNKIYIETINNLLQNLSGILPDERLDSESRDQIINLILKATDDLKDIVNKNAERSNKVKKALIYTIATTFVLSVTSWLIFGNKKSK